MGGVENIEHWFGNGNVGIPAGFRENGVNSQGILVVPQRLQVDQAIQNLVKNGRDHRIENILRECANLEMSHMLRNWAFHIQQAVHQALGSSPQLKVFLLHLTRITIHFFELDIARMSVYMIL
jgi:hypothetical protein